MTAPALVITPSTGPITVEVRNLPAPTTPLLVPIGVPGLPGTPADMTAVESAIGDEAIARAAADAALDARLDVLETDPTTAENVADAVAAEATLRATADAVLAAAIAAETSARGDADAALDGRIDALEADQTTATAVAAVAAAVDAEVAARTAADSSLTDAIAAKSDGWVNGLIAAAVGTVTQAYSATLDALAALTTTVFGRSLLTLDDALEARSALDLGPFSVERSGRDANGIYVTLTWSRPDTTTAITSVLSGGSTPEYALRTVTRYDTDGSTVVATDVYDLTYSNGEIVSEVLQ